MSSLWNSGRATLVVLLAGIVLALASWIGNLYDWPVRNMLSPEGFRWMLQSLLPNVEASPWFTLFILTLGLGVWRESGLSQAIFRVISRRRRGGLSPKRRQALLLGGASLVFYLIILCWVTFSRHEILLGVTGTLERSPFLAGWPLLLSLAVALPGAVYGLTAGEFRGVVDLLQSLSSLFRSMAGFFVYLFCAIQWLAMFQYTVQAQQFRSMLTYEILLIVVIGGIGSISGSCIASFLYIALSEWWLRGLDMGTFLGIHAENIFRSGFRRLVFSVIIMVIVLFFSRGLMGDKELSWARTSAWLRRTFRKREAV